MHDWEDVIVRRDAHVCWRRLSRGDNSVRWSLACTSFGLIIAKNNLQPHNAGMNWEDLRWGTIYCMRILMTSLWLTYPFKNRWLSVTQGGPRFASRKECVISALNVHSNWFVRDPVSLFVGLWNTGNSKAVNDACLCVLGSHPSQHLCIYKWKYALNTTRLKCTSFHKHHLPPVKKPLILLIITFCAHIYPSSANYRIYFDGRSCWEKWMVIYRSVWCFYY